MGLPGRLTESYFDQLVMPVQQPLLVRHILFYSYLELRLAPNTDREGLRYRLAWGGQFHLPRGGK
jgi:hypothetical protein